MPKLAKPFARKWPSRYSPLMKRDELIKKLKGLPETAEVYGQFYLKDAQAVLLPVSGVRLATSDEKTKTKIPAEHNIIVISSEDSASLS